MLVDFWDGQQGACAHVCIIYWCCWLTSCHPFHEIENVACEDDKGWHREGDVMWGWCGSDVRVTWRGWCVVRVVWGLTLWTGQIWQAASLGGPSPPCSKAWSRRSLNHKCTINLQKIYMLYKCSNIPIYNSLYILNPHQGCRSRKKAKGRRVQSDLATVFT